MKTTQDIYKYCTVCATELKADDGHKVCPNCGKHYYFNAKPCVAILITNDEGEVLMTKRAADPFKDWWDVPGGFVEEHETLEEAMRRELKEETGLEVSDLKYEGSLWEDYHFQGEIVPIVAAFFSGKAAGSQEVTVDDDVSDYKFVPREAVDVESIAFKNQREFVRRIL